MKKAEAISILATSVRPREAKDRARYDEAVKMAIEALKSSERTAEASQTDHIADSDKKVERDDESAQNVKDGDLIFRQAAIDAIRKIYDSVGILGEKWAVDKCQMAIKDLPSAQPEQRWIPCSERLPEQYGNYLVSYRTDDFESDIGTFDPDRINSDTGKWSACDANGFYWVASKGLEVIAWMPLPAQYIPEGDDKHEG